MYDQDPLGWHAFDCPAKHGSFCECDALDNLDPDTINVLAWMWLAAHMLGFFSLVVILHYC